MINLSKMQKNIDGLLSIFTELTLTLDDNVEKLSSGIRANKDVITNLEKQNNDYSDKIKEYKALSESVKNLIKPSQNQGV